MANFNYLSKDKVENVSIKNKSTYLLEGMKFVIQIVKKPVNNRILSEKGFLCLNKHGGAMSAGEYFYLGSPIKPANPCEQLLVFYSSDEAEKYVKDNLIQMWLCSNTDDTRSISYSPDLKYLKFNYLNYYLNEATTIEDFGKTGKID